MLTPAVPEQVARSIVQRVAQLSEGGMQRTLAGNPVQMLLMLQRTAGNQAVNQLLRQYKAGRLPSPGPLLPAVQRCGGKPCNCSPKEKAAHTQVQALEEDQVPAVSAIALPSLQRDADDDDDAGSDDSTAGPVEQSAEADAESADTADQSTEEPSEESEQSESASEDTDDGSAGQTDDDSETAPAPNDADEGEQSAADPDQTADSGDADDSTADTAAVEPVGPVSGEGEPHEEEVHGGGSLNLLGVTNSHYKSSFDAGAYTTNAGEYCTGCADADCVNVVGTLTSTFTMTTDVVLPKIPAGMTATQKTVVQYAIDNCISPHEQQHVTAFNAYNGTVQTPFDINCCRAAVVSSIKAVHTDLESTRHDTVSNASKALDPFPASVDLDCDGSADPSSCMTCPPPPAP